LEREQKFDEAGGGGEREGTLARKPLDFEKPVRSLREDQTGTREGEPIFDSLICQPFLALLSRFSCPDKVRPNFRSW